MMFLFITARHCTVFHINFLATVLALSIISTDSVISCGGDLPSITVLFCRLETNRDKELQAGWDNHGEPGNQVPTKSSFSTEILSWSPAF